MANKRMRGRPRGAANTETIVHKIAFEKHPAPKGYRSQKITTVELLFFVLRNKVMQGDITACQLFDELLEQYTSYTKMKPTIIEVQFVSSNRIPDKLDSTMMLGSSWPSKE